MLQDVRVARRRRIPVPQGYTYPTIFCRIIDHFTDLDWEAEEVGSHCGGV
jgi:hypothetical protein